MLNENGTPHIQGYVRKAKKRFNSVEQILGLRVQIEPAKGYEGQNEDYCKNKLGWLQWKVENQIAPYQVRAVTLPAVTRSEK